MTWRSVYFNNETGVNSLQLRAIADALDGLAALPIEVSEVKVGSMRVQVQRFDHQRDGAYYILTGIVRSE